MANEDVKFARGLSSAIPVEKVPGRFLFETDTGVLHLDVDNNNRKPVADSRVTNLISRVDDLDRKLYEEFSGTKLASIEGTRYDLGVNFKIVHLTSPIEDLPNFQEVPAPTDAIMMVSKVKESMSNTTYIQILFCDTGSVYSRPVLYYSGSYSNDPWVKVGPGAGGDQSNFVLKSGDNMTGDLSMGNNGVKSSKILSDSDIDYYTTVQYVLSKFNNISVTGFNSEAKSVSSLTDSYLFASVTGNGQTKAYFISYSSQSDLPSNSSDYFDKGIFITLECIYFDGTRAYYRQTIAGYQGPRFERTVEMRYGIGANATSDWVMLSPCVVVENGTDLSSLNVPKGTIILEKEA